MKATEKLALLQMLQLGIFKSHLEVWFPEPHTDSSTRAHILPPFPAMLATMVAVQS
jgi:hypothetical protein